MGVMTKMRENTGVVLWILVLAFGGLWVLQDSGALGHIGVQSQQNIAVVNGDPITYQEYTQALEQEVRAHQQQTGEAPAQALRDQIADEVFERLIEDRLRQQAMDRLGVTVADTEVRELFWGPRFDPIMAQLFPDGSGGVDRAQLREVVALPEAEAEVVAVQDYLRAKRRAEKLEALLGATLRVSEAEVAAEYVRRHSSAAVDYIALRHASIPDEEVSLEERDLRAFYERHREDFKRERTVTAQYVLLPQAPSAADSAAALKDLRRFADDFAVAEDDSAFVASHFSQTPFSRDYLGALHLAPEAAAAVFEDLTVGRVVGPLLAGGEVQLLKITGTRPAGQTAVRARHILLGQRGDSPEQRARQREEAEALLERLARGEPFEELARRYSQDPGSARMGGDLGFFGPGRMVAPFEEAAFGARPGELVGPVETEYGYHLIRVESRAEQEVQLAALTQSVGFSSATLRALRDRAEDVQYYAAEGGDFEAEAERQGLEVQSVTVQGEPQSIPGIGTSRTVRTFLARARKGALSEVIDTGTDFVVLHVTEVLPEGYRPLAEVEEEIEPRVRHEKKKEIQTERLREALAEHGFEGLGAALGTEPRSATVSFQNLIVSGLGREPRFVGTALGLEEGQTSGVVTGQNAAYVLHVREANRAHASGMSEAARQRIRTELLDTKRQLLITNWLKDLREEADIEDHRSLFL